MNILLCDILGKNKIFIPQELLPATDKKEFSSMFAFMKIQSMVFYILKKTAVILLSTEHKGDKN